MAKKPKEEVCQDQESAFDIIELAIDDIELLTKAFHVINKICHELDAGEAPESGIPEQLLH